MSQVIASHIEIRTNRNGKPRAFITGTRVRVQDIFEYAEMQGYTPDQIAVALPALTLGQIHAALSYFFDHPREIKAAIREDHEYAESVRKKFGDGLLANRLRSLSPDGNHPDDDEISSG